jgi:hypothetical protein
MTMPNILVILIVCSALLSLLFFIATVAALRKNKFLSTAFRFLLALLALSSAGLLGMIVIATEGYRALTHDEIAAIVTTEPMAAAGCGIWLCLIHQFRQTRTLRDTGIHDGAFNQKSGKWSDTVTETLKIT